MIYPTNLKSAFLLLASVSLLGHMPLVHGHSGGTDSNGCHSGSKPFHCHTPKSNLNNSSYRPNYSLSGSSSYEQPYSKPSDKAIETKCTSSGCTITNINTRQKQKTNVLAPTKAKRNNNPSITTKTPDPKQQPKKAPDFEKDFTNIKKQDVGSTLEAELGHRNSNNTKETKKTQLEPEISDKPVDPDNSSKSGNPQNNQTPKITSEDISRPNLPKKLPTPFKNLDTNFNLAWIYLFSLILISTAIAARQLRRFKQRRFLEKVNKDIAAIPYYYGDGKTVVKLQSVLKDGSLYKFISLQLEYDPQKPFLTSKTIHSSSISINNLQGFIAKKSGNIFPEIPFKDSTLKLLDNKTDYYLLVSQQHTGWEALEKSERARLDLIKITEKIKSNKNKYIKSDYFKDSQEKIDQLILDKEKQTEWINSTITSLQKIIHKRTLQIESFEDFGGLLIGLQNMPLYAHDNDFHQPTSGQIKSVADYLERTLFELEAYGELIEE